MNSLNLLSGRVSAPQSPGPSRSSSYGNIFPSTSTKEFRKNQRGVKFNDKATDFDAIHNEAVTELVTDDIPQLEKLKKNIPSTLNSRWLVIPKRLSSVVADSIRWILSALSAPGAYILASMYDESGYFAPRSQIAKFGIILCGGSRRASTAQALGLSSSNEEGNSLSNKSAIKSKPDVTKAKTSKKTSPSTSGALFASKSIQANRRPVSEVRRRIHHIAPQNNDSVTSSGKYIHSGIQDKDASYNQKYRKTPSNSTQKVSHGTISASEITPSSLKSPVSPASSTLMSKYTNTTEPPRPLIPPRQPSYAKKNGKNGRFLQKTLILDLDETLIHSMAKGGRMSTGNMVEVKLNTIVVADGSRALGLQHPILYWVNKRPHCDDFLRLVCKWYNLIVFTASVQEYADPVIDLLEQDRKLFSGRYYRQHCTYRQGAYIKDLSFIEPDLSKVMILDNSPLSYMFHQENAIPIEGWINDPTDNDLLHLIPLLESLQYVTDVRTFLALRGGENGKLL